MNGNTNSIQYRSYVPKASQNGSSFSTYLKPERPKTGRGEDVVGGTVDDCDQISVFDAEDYFSEGKTKPVLKMEDNATLDHSVANSRPSSISSSIEKYGRIYRVNSFQATPTASSEASWNSQTGLLTNTRGSVPVSLRSFSNASPKKGSKTVKNWSLKCPCLCKKSVQVKGKIPDPPSISSAAETRKQTDSTPIPSIFDSGNGLYSTIFEPRKNPNPASIPPILELKRNSNSGIDPINVPKTQTLESQRSSFTSNEQNSEKIFSNFRRFSLDNQIPKTTHLRTSHLNPNPNGFSFSFPILNSNPRVENIKNLLPNPNPNPLSLEDPPRESLEVFQPAPESGGRFRRNYPFPASPMSRIASGDEDMASDASSDLFEIDSFANIIYRDSIDETTMFNNRGSVDSVAATECYVPSEASVEWSVATGEGCGSVGNFSASVSQVGFGAKYEDPGVSGEGVTWHTLGMGCRGDKAVSVGRRVGKEGGPWGDRAAWEGW